MPTQYRGSGRRVQLRENDRVTPCPKCRNNTIFDAHSQQVAEDCCEVYVACTCGYDPTAERTGYRLEDVWGGVGDENVAAALSCWNEALAESTGASHGH